MKPAGVKYERPSENLSSCAEHKQEHSRCEVSWVHLQFRDNLHTHSHSTVGRMINIAVKQEAGDKSPALLKIPSTRL